MQNNKSNPWKDFVSPVLVLAIICFAVTFALAFVYGITKPIITSNATKEANAARTKILPEAEGKFSEYDGKKFILEDKKVFVEECFEADNRSGMVVTVKSNSYGGLLTAMIGIDKDGAITNVKVTEAGDTPGIGTKAQAPSHLKQYAGRTELSSKEVKQDKDINHISGASVSSGAVHKAVYCALKQYEDMGGVK